MSRDRVVNKPAYFAALAELARTGLTMKDIAAQLHTPESRAKLEWAAFRTPQDEQVRKTATKAKMSADAKERPQRERRQSLERAPMTELFIGALQGFHDDPEAKEDKGSTLMPKGRELNHSPSGSSMGWAG